MIKLGKELGLTPIKCGNREGTPQLKELHYKINDILYKWSGKYLFQTDAEQVFRELCGYGKELSALVVPGKASAKKSELITALRKVCTSLREYCKNEQTSEDLELMQKAVNFFLHKAIEAKNEGLTVEKAVGLLQEQKELWQNIGKFLDNLRVSNYLKMNRELLDYLIRNLQCNDGGLGDD